MTTVRRDFLKLAGAGLPGISLGAHANAATKPGAAANAVFDVRTFGARGDGASIDTPAINKAIEEQAPREEEPFDSPSAPMPATRSIS